MSALRGKADITDRSNRPRPWLPEADKPGF